MGVIRTWIPRGFAALPWVVSLLWLNPAQAETTVFNRENLVAWCIVPFDARQRGPEARAEMLARMGIRQLAYDWRAEHIPTFDEEMETLKRWGIGLKAFWFPAALNDEARAILDVLKRHGIQTELWVSMHGGEIACTPEEHVARVQAHVEALRPLVDAAAEIGCTVGLYNHGGWFGEPENQLEIIKQLNAPNVGIVYNLHHGHGHLDRFETLLAQMQPHLLCLNLNGMNTGGDERGEKILPLGNGEHDARLLQIIARSGYTGPIGILGHTMDDAEDTLLDNLDGLEWLVAQLDGSPPPGPRPPQRVSAAGAARGVPGPAPEFGLALEGGLVVEGAGAFREPPITIECRARLDSAANYNILVASDTKASGAHWELFTEAGTGHLAFYAPGIDPDHVRTDVNVCDGQWRQFAVQYSAQRVRLYIDSTLAASLAVVQRGMSAQPGGLGLGRLVEGGLYCDGAIDDVRVTLGLRPITGVMSPADRDADTLGLWDFDALPTAAARAPEVEDPSRRAALPLFQVISAASNDALSPAVAMPSHCSSNWPRSHGDEFNTRYSKLTQITRDNVGDLALAWEYRSGDGAGNVQCNPIVVDGVFFGPTAGHRLVALDAATGGERWHFDPGAQPAYRGLVYWPGTADAAPRLLFNAGDSLWALDPKTGKPIGAFGEQGRVQTGEVRVAGAVFENVLILPGYERDVFGLDVVTGERLWTFHTIPQPGEYGHDTWEQPGQGANCWGGMALDPARGIAYVSTGSPKPNFAGNTHRGQNLFANCVIALDARTGDRLWHFQEIRHDIWDLDIPAPPNLVTLNRGGRRVDAVAQVTKLGNTLLLDRVTGQPVFDVRLRRAPVSLLPGERTWPYQPDIARPVPFAKQGFTQDDVTDRSPEARAHVLERLRDAATGWFEPFGENRPTALYGIHGGAEWTGAAVDPASGRLYVSANNIPWIITVFQPDAALRAPGAPPTHGEQVYTTHCAECHGAGRFGVGMNPPLHGLAKRYTDDDVRALIQAGRGLMPAIADTVSDADIDALIDYLMPRDGLGQAAANMGGPPRYTHNGYPKLLDHEGYPGSKPPWGTLNCLDLSSGDLLWQVPLGVYPELAAWGEDDTGAENFGGPSVTAGGLVLCGGTPDNRIRAFDSDTGSVLWEHALPYGGYAPPTIYEADGRQFVVIAATGGGKLGTPPGDAYIAFALPGEF